MNEREALKLALEALDGLSEPYDVLKAQEAIREALAQPEQEQDRQIDQLIQERDHRDEIIDKLCDAVLGPDRYEWSSQYFFEDAVREVEERMAALEAQPEQEPDGVGLVVSGAIFDFAGYLTTRDKVIEVGSTANASPVADLVKEWAALRGLSLENPAVLSWQEWLIPISTSDTSQERVDETSKQRHETQPEQEPVAYIRVSKTGHVMACAKTGDFYSLPHKTLRYTTPPSNSLNSIKSSNTLDAQRKPLPKGEWPKHPSGYVGDVYKGYDKSDLDNYAMQVLAAHGIKE